jgi:hypothetical protein
MMKKLGVLLVLFALVFSFAESVPAYENPQYQEDYDPCAWCVYVPAWCHVCYVIMWWESGGDWGWWE